MRNWASWDYLGCALVRLGSVLGHAVKGSWRRPRAILVRVEGSAGVLGSFWRVLGASWGILGGSALRGLGNYLTYFSTHWKSYDLKMRFSAILISISSHIISILSHIISISSHMISGASGWHYLAHKQPLEPTPATRVYY